MKFADYCYHRSVCELGKLPKRRGVLELAFSEEMNSFCKTTINITFNSVCLPLVFNSCTLQSHYYHCRVQMFQSTNLATREAGAEITAASCYDERHPPAAILDA